MVAKRTNRPVFHVKEDRVGQEMPNSKTVIVSSDDRDLLTRLSWSMDGRGYVVAFLGRENGKQKFAKLHRLVVSAEDDQIVDHIDGDKLNCCRDNLRIATKSTNAANIRKVRASAGFKGVRVSVLTQHLRKPYQSAIVIGGKTIYLGTFETAEMAAIAYDDAAVTAFGEYAATNKKLGLL